MTLKIRSKTHEDVGIGVVKHASGNIAGNEGAMGVINKKSDFHPVRAVLTSEGVRATSSDCSSSSFLSSFFFLFNCFPKPSASTNSI
ncbi:hypothetical protein VNO77_06580 [Canavalia gladiata]|uniref:Uncharacterized protein n=1 Tax=Canavalia gladiata TaxID=3824 RepID=A0AAN9QSZ7_CANGL